MLTVSQVCRPTELATSWAPPGTVLSRLSRAREKLQQEIEGTVDGAPKNVVQLRSMK